MNESLTNQGFGFDRTLRLTRRHEFDRAFKQGKVAHAGVMRLHGVPNGLEHSRLGMVVSRRVGSAVKRNRIKRLLREAFRLNRHCWPIGYDWVVVVKAHEPKPLQHYVEAMDRATHQIAAQKRQSSTEADT